MIRGARIVTVAVAALLAGCTTETPSRTPLPSPGESIASPASLLSSPSASPGAVSASPSASIVPGTRPIGQAETATVLRVIDGDTIEVDRGHGPEKLRYIGVDSPENLDPGRPVEFMAQEASQANAELVDGRTVILEPDVSETDSFGRLLRYVWLEDPSQQSGFLLVNRELVRQGFAKAVSYPPDVRYDELFAEAQSVASAAAIGLWASPSVEIPAESAPAESDCHASYSPCLPIVDDLDCADIRAMGAAPVRVVGSDPYRLDRDGDGVGCE